ncbi:unnamed protein product [Ambrosiozyma monospora]|uniref:Unnamed protein product n=1 Tax=Ambrosiozyma monospora TaxID=43982 RepID=A0ACB5SSA1_AMBMO|nr:unnamed protein product [Ambrosiozyma monospora]
MRLIDIIYHVYGTVVSCIRTIISKAILLPIHWVSLLIDHSQSLGESKIKKKLSDRDFQKFKDVMLDEEMPLDLSLMIWDVVVSEILDLVELLDFTKNQTTHLDKLSFPLNTSIRMCSFMSTTYTGFDYS